MAVRGRPMGLVLIAALLIVLSLRAVVWLIGDQLLIQGFLGPVGRVAAVTMVVVGLASAAGLLLKQRWARWLALGLCTGYGVLLIVGVIAGLVSQGLDGIDIGRVLLSAFEAVVFAGAAWLYLTRPEVLALLGSETD